jgi:hypothetical protein
MLPCMGSNEQFDPIRVELEARGITPDGVGLFATERRAVGAGGGQHTAEEWDLLAAKPLGQPAAVESFGMIEHSLQDLTDPQSAPQQSLADPRMFLESLARARVG